MWTVCIKTYITKKCEYIGKMSSIISIGCIYVFVLYIYIYTMIYIYNFPISETSTQHQGVQKSLWEAIRWMHTTYYNINAKSSNFSLAI